MSGLTHETLPESFLSHVSVNTCISSGKVTIDTSALTYASIHLNLHSKCQHVHIFSLHAKLLSICQHWDMQFFMSNHERCKH